MVDQPTNPPASCPPKMRSPYVCGDGAAQTVEGAFPLSACYQLLSRGRRRRSWCGVSIPVAARSHPIARSLCPYHQRPIRARPPAPVRPRVRTLQARPPACAAPRWRDFGCADVSGNPLALASRSVPLSPSLRFPGPETEPRVARPLARRFLCFTANHGKTRRKMHLLCKHAAVTREDGWKEELVTHSGAIQLHSLS